MNLEGQSLGEFEIIAQLGQGGMGAVYKARQTTLRRTVALKTLQASLAGDADYVARFQQEAMAAAVLSHPNLVQVHSAGENDGLHWFAMEYVDGESARERLRRKGRLDPLEALAIVLHVAAALEYAWRKAGLIHRDIKPDNIFLSSDGEVKLGDLGLAKSVGQAQNLTLTGASMGTPLYMSPEQVQGLKDVDLRSDIYSLGCTLYHFLTGLPPYEANSAVGIMMKHVNSPVPNLRSVWPECPPELATVVMKMMFKPPDARPQSYEELDRELRRVYDLLSMSPIPENVIAAQSSPARTAPARTPRATPPAIAPSKSKIPLFAGLGVVALGLAVAAFFFLRPAITPSVPAPRIVDLLPLVDIKRDAVLGTWSRKPEGLSLDSPPSKFGVCELPYEPPAEYDFEADFTPISPGNNVNFHLFAGGASFIWKLNAYGQTPPIYGLDLLDGKLMSRRSEAEATNPLMLQNGTRYTTRFEVRTSKLRGFVAGTEIFSWSGDYHRLSTETDGKLRNPRALGVGSYGRAVIFHRIEVHEITGTGRIIGGAPAPGASSLGTSKTARPAPSPALLPAMQPASASADGAIVYSGKPGPGAGKHIVLISGEEEYRSEESLPMLAKILSQRHGFKCTVLFAVDKDGVISPQITDSLPGAAALDSADAIVMLVRYRAWPDQQMKHFVDARLRGVPIIALRTSTHAFRPAANSSYSQLMDFGKTVLGEGWVGHWGERQKEGTRGVIVPSAKDDPIVQSVENIFGSREVYEAYPPPDARILLRGQVLTGRNAGDPPASYRKRRTNDHVEQDINDPMMPIAWTRTVPNQAGRTTKVFCTTMGDGADFQNEGFRRLLVNSVYSLLDLRIPEKADVSYVGNFNPSPSVKSGVKPSDFALAPSSSSTSGK